MKRKLAMALGRSMAACASLYLSSCVLLDPVPPCSDLEPGDRLLVTIREPLEEAACDPELGFLDGAELTLTVEAYGEGSVCSSPIGPTAIDGVELEYWVEASESASGSAAFVSVSREFGPCLGGVNFSILPDETPSETEKETFDQMRITYQGSSDEGCPAYCNAPYAVDVERL